MKSEWQLISGIFDLRKSLISVKIIQYRRNVFEKKVPSAIWLKANLFGGRRGSVENKPQGVATSVEIYFVENWPQGKLICGKFGKKKWCQGQFIVRQMNFIKHRIDGNLIQGNIDWRTSRKFNLRESWLQGKLTSGKIDAMEIWPQGKLPWWKTDCKENWFQGNWR